MLKAVELTTDEAKLGELYGELSWSRRCAARCGRSRPTTRSPGAGRRRRSSFALPDSRSHGYALTAKAMREDDVSRGRPGGRDRRAARRRRAALLRPLRTLGDRSGGGRLRRRLGVGPTAARARAAAYRSRPPRTHPLGLLNRGTCARPPGKRESHALRHDAIAARLTPHHEVHALGNLLTLKRQRVAGTASTSSTTAEQAVAENVGTPCVYSARSSLVCAVACAEFGLVREARSWKKTRPLGSRATACGSTRCGHGWP